MKKLTLNYDLIDNIIDEAIEDNESVTFICDSDMAEYIEDYMDNEYGIEDECEETPDEDEVYVVTINSIGTGFELYIETFITENGVYRSIENIGTCYDLSDVDKNIVLDKVDTDEIVICDFEYEDDNDEKFDENETCDCAECKCANAYMDFVCQEILKTMQLVSDDEACGKCKFEALLNIFELGGCGVVSGILSDEFFITADEE